MANEQNGNMPPGYSADDLVNSSPASNAQQPPLTAQGGLPPGYSASDLVNPSTQASPNNGNESSSGGILDTLKGVSTGIDKGFMHTVGGVYDLASKIPGVQNVLDSADKVMGYTDQDEQQAKDLAHSSLNGTAENVGGGIESIGEFLLGDAAFTKGLSGAERLLKTAKVVKMLENAPRLQRALQLGINIGKVGEALGPTERAILKDNPVLARLVGVGVTALRQGVMQAGQTYVKSSGDSGVLEAGKQGLEMTGGAAAFGIPFGVVGGVLEHGAQAANTAEELRAAAQEAPTASEGNAALTGAVTNATQPAIDAAQATQQEAEGKLAGATSAIADQGGYAESAPTREAITNKAQAYAKSGEQAIRDAYTKASEAIRNDPALEGLTVPGTGSAFQEKAANAAFGQQNGDPIRKALGASIPASPDVMNLVTNLAKPGGLLDVAEDGTPREMDINQLMDYAKDVKDKLRKVGYSTPQEMRDRQVYYDLLDGIHESVDELVGQAGKPELMDQLQQMNTDYRNGIQTFKNPDVQSLLRGSNENAIINTLTGGKSVGDIQEMRKAIGKDAFSSLSDDAMQRIAADSINPTTGEFDLAKWVRTMSNIPDAVRGEMVNGTTKGVALENILQQVRNVQGTGVIKTSSQSIKDSQDLMKSILGNTADLTGMTKDPEKVQDLSNLVGPDAMGALGDIMLHSQLREAASTLDKSGNTKIGSVDTGKVLRFFESLKDSPEVVDAFFKPTPKRAAAYSKLLQSVHNVEGVKNMVKIGLVAPAIGAAVGGAVGHSAFSALLGSMAAEAGGGYFSKARDFLDTIANHPAMWATLKGAGSFAAHPVTQATQHIARVAAAKGLVNADGSLRNILNGTQTQLGQ